MYLLRIKDIILWRDDASSSPFFYLKKEKVSKFVSHYTFTYYLNEFVPCNNRRCRYLATCRNQRFSPLSLNPPDNFDTPDRDVRTFAPTSKTCQLLFVSKSNAANSTSNIYINNIYIAIFYLWIISVEIKKIVLTRIY